MEGVRGVIILVILFLLFFLLARRLFIKNRLYFKLLKRIYPKKLEYVKSHFHFMIIPHATNMGFNLEIWFWLPFYRSKIPLEKFDEESLKLHYKLKQNNKKTAILLTSFIMYYISLWIFAYFFH